MGSNASKESSSSPPANMSDVVPIKQQQNPPGVEQGKEQLEKPDPAQQEKSTSLDKQDQPIDQESESKTELAPPQPEATEQQGESKEQAVSLQEQPTQSASSQGLSDDEQEVLEIEVPRMQQEDRWAFIMDNQPYQPRPLSLINLREWLLTNEPIILAIMDVRRIEELTAIYSRPLLLVLQDLVGNEQELTRAPLEKDGLTPLVRNGTLPPPEALWEEIFARFGNYTSIPSKEQFTRLCKGTYTKEATRGYCKICFCRPYGQPYTIHSPSSCPFKGEGISYVILAGGRVCHKCGKRDSPLAQHNCFVSDVRCKVCKKGHPAWTSLCRARFGQEQQWIATIEQEIRTELGHARNRNLKFALPTDRNIRLDVQQHGEYLGLRNSTDPVFQARNWKIIAGKEARLRKLFSIIDKELQEGVIISVQEVAEAMAELEGEDRQWARKMAVDERNNEVSRMLAARNAMQQQARQAAQQAAEEPAQQGNQQGEQVEANNDSDDGQPEEEEEEQGAANGANEQEPHEGEE